MADPLITDILGAAKAAADLHRAAYEQGVLAGRRAAFLQIEAIAAEGRDIELGLLIRVYKNLAFGLRKADAEKEGGA